MHLHVFNEGLLFLHFLFQFFLFLLTGLQKGLLLFELLLEFFIFLLQGSDQDIVYLVMFYTDTHLPTEGRGSLSLLLSRRTERLT